MWEYQPPEAHVSYQSDLLTFDIPGTPAQRLNKVVERAKELGMEIYSKSSFFINDMTDYDLAEGIIERLIKERLNEGVDELIRRAKIYRETEVVKKLEIYKDETSRIGHEDIELIFMHVDLSYYTTVIRNVAIPFDLFIKVDAGKIYTKGKPVMNVW